MNKGYEMDKSTIITMECSYVSSWSSTFVGVPMKSIHSDIILEYLPVHRQTTITINHSDGLYAYRVSVESEGLQINGMNFKDWLDNEMAKEV